ncbi:YggS family pyridoxal phosphate-dependent enzyme [Sulfobacillus thermosulfidooxidans]|uniref:YggS family pyridoxal phosphate-dependent enzyme n=1 Tax=Sulfobacillus thermosulfidooxidans TaxID=28034 RepID=UPI000419D69F|nr:YggS family pyridoxal phosphate-dependent enzyme [Sulfobacillus thermosulfidooxidans]
MYEQITENVQRILEMIHRIRPGETVKLMAVTKTRTREEALIALQAGAHLLGENKVQEALNKFSEKPPAPLHMIGHLQTNKVKYAIDLFDAIDSIDSERIADALNRRLKTPMPVMLEINAGKEPSKTGMFFEDVQPFLAKAEQWKNLRFIGMMALFPAAADKSSVEKKKIRDLMKETGELWRIAQQEGFPWAPLTELSMGMSEDYEWALETGTTMIRLGTAIFGPRPKT